MTQQRSCDRTRFSEAARPVLAFAKAGAIALLALGLFASSPYTNEARAITDSAPNAVNASLVFSIAYLAQNQGGQLCAHNYNNASVSAAFVLATSNPESDPPALPVTIEPNQSRCENFTTDFPAISARPAIVFKSPVECSQATDYPGKCRVVGSFEIFEAATGLESLPIRHLEPVLLPGLPGSPRLTNLPQ
jgi:hypothetical protein